MAIRVSKVMIVQGSLCVILYQFRHRIKINAEWKMQRSTNSRNTTNNIRAVNWCTIPSLSSCNTSRNKYIVSAMLLCGYCDTIIEKAMEVFNRKPFVIAFSENIVVQVYSLELSLASHKSPNIMAFYHRKTTQEPFIHHVLSNIDLLLPQRHEIHPDIYSSMDQRYVCPASTNKQYSAHNQSTYTQSYIKMYRRLKQLHPKKPTP